MGLEGEGFDCGGGGGGGRYGLRAVGSGIAGHNRYLWWDTDTGNWGKGVTV